MEPRTIALGRIVKAHGIRGEVSVEPWLECGDALAPGARLWLRGSEGEARPGRVETSRPHGRRVLIRLEGVSDRDRAEALVHAEIHVDRRRLPPLEEGEYLWEDLVGLAVVDDAGNPVGRLTGMLATGPGGENELLVVQAGDEEVLLPMTREVVREVDLEGGRMRVSVPEGLRVSGGEGDDL
ncbi:MAG: ribosome maturation factor RimM [Nitrospinota bacterium]|nr:ribosome maturation factor RimM [Nitrospinota bacterium]MDP6620299.1 ribosome maturation factor RimM [Nitrospinota bacterium]HJM44155.1 ribosome maturation factor RimM [Nitrospinota bacterium]